MSPSPKPIVVVGSINLDLVANATLIPAPGQTVSGTDFQTHPGGKGANQAVAAGRLGYPVHMIGRVGDDAFGPQLRQGLASAGVDTTGVLTTPGSSGVAVIVVADSGENSIVVIPGANACVTPADIDANLEKIRAAGVILAQLEIPLETIQHLAAICNAENIPLILDPAPARELPADLFPRITWFTPNETEAAFFLGKNASSSQQETATSLLAKGVKNVILKLGSKGAYLASTLREEGHAITPFRVRPVDTTAAGDCFNGAFAVALLLGKSPEESARFAAAAAAISVTRPGAQPSMPTLGEVEKLLATQSVE